MRYSYLGVSLGDSLEKIINLFTKEKIYYDNFFYRLIFKFNKNSFSIRQLDSRFSIPIITGKVVYMIIFDENFKLFNELEIWQELTDEIKEKYELYYDEDDDGIYLSKKYKYLKIGVEGGYIEDPKERIFSFIFDAQKDIPWKVQENKMENYLKCKNLMDIYGFLYENKSLDVNIEKKEIYGQVNNYKFTFDLMTRNIKNIQNLETGKFIKTFL